MATFLELCVKLAEESNTGNAPSTVVGQTGRAKKVVGWVREAWVYIQNLNPYWLFLRAEFEDALVADTGTYEADDFTLARFGGWIGGRTVSLYDPAIGRADESYLRQIPFDVWKQRWDFGVNDANRPTEYAIGPDDTLRFGAVPDDAYALRGSYVKTPQVLAVDADVPDMPARFHDIIVWRALMLLAMHDEAVTQMQLATGQFKELLTSMERDQLPIVNARAGRALA